MSPAVDQVDVAIPGDNEFSNLCHDRRLGSPAYKVLRDAEVKQHSIQRKQAFRRILENVPNTGKGDIDLVNSWDFNGTGKCCTGLVAGQVYRMPVHRSRADSIRYVASRASLALSLSLRSGN